MTVYRPEDAIARWRHLTVIAPHVLIPAVGVDRTMNATEQTTAEWYAETWASCVLEWSNGMCFVQDLIVAFPDTWTLGTFTGGEYYASYSDIKAALAPLGHRADQYDSLTLLAPKAAFAATANGRANTAQNHGGSCTVFITDNQTPPSYGPTRAVHEWLHIAVRFYEDDGGYPQPSIDSPENYRYLDDSPIPVSSGYQEFMTATLIGNLEETATSTQMGITPEAWGYGTPRWNFPS